MDIIAAFVNCGTPCISRDSDGVRADDVNGRRQRALTFRVAWAEGARPFERSRDGATIIPVANIASSQSNKAVAFQIPCSIGCFVSACSLSAHTGVGARSCKALVSTDVGLAQCEAYVIHFNVWVRSCHFDVQWMNPLQPDCGADRGPSGYRMRRQGGDRRNSDGK